MNCDAARAEISSGFDGDDLDLAVDEHLAHCASCNAFADEILAIRRHLRIGTAIEVPDIGAAVLERLAPAAAPTAASRRIRARRLAAVAAAAAAMAVTTISVDREPTAPGGDEVAVGAGDILVAWSDRDLPDGLQAEVASWSPVFAATEAQLGSANLARPGDPRGSVGLEMFGYDPSTYPPFASATNRSDFYELGPGEVLISARAAAMQGLTEGEVMAFDNGIELRVAGVVADADMAAAEIAVTNATADSLGTQSQSYLLIEHDGVGDSVETDLSAATDGVSFRAGEDAEFLRGGDDPTPAIDRKEVFGEVSVVTRDESTTVTDPAWASDNITESNMPLIGKVSCHRQVLRSLASAMGQLDPSEINPALTTRCWVPVVDPSDTALSLHAWGIAVNLNFDAVAGTTQVSDTVIEVMDTWGFDAITTEQGLTTFVWRTTGLDPVGSATNDEG